MKTEPRDQIKRLADFLGCPFTKQEEDNGVVDKVLDLCSLRNLSSLEVNKTLQENMFVARKIFQGNNSSQICNGSTSALRRKKNPRKFASKKFSRKIATNLRDFSATSRKTIANLR